MLTDLIAQRAQQADAHDRVRARFPTSAYQSAAFGAALTPIATRLGQLARAMADVAEAPPAEIARSSMWYGDALFDLAQGGHVRLEDALAAYREADPWVRVARDPVLAAKYDGNLANMLMRGAPSRAALRDVVARYERAIAGLRPPPAAYQAGLSNARTLLDQFDELDREVTARVREARVLLAGLSSHDLPPSAAAAIASALQELAGLEAVETLQDAARYLDSVQRTWPRVMALAAERHAAPPPSRGGQTARLVMELWQELMTEALTYIDAGLREEMFATARTLVECAVAVRAAGSTSAAIEVERLRVRDAAATARRLLAHAHVTWIEPRWPTPRVVPLAGTAHVVAASGEREAVLRSICAERGLTVAPIAIGPDLAARRFDAMRESLVVVVDLLDGPAGLAAACYELGIALVLGKPVVVVAGPDPLPFDIDVDPVRSADPAAIGDAIDRALVARYRVGAAGAASALSAVAAAVRRRFPDQRFLMDTVDAQVERPLAMAAALEAVLQAQRQTTPSSAIVAYPAWPRTYPPVEPRVFHIMPFRAPWSNQVRDVARGALESAGAVYRRHDAVADPQILRSLWDELTSATHFVVDLTGHNPNVALELGVADALGTPTLLVGQPGTVEQLIPMLRRTRVTTYTLDDLSALAAACRGFIAPA